MGFTHRTIVYTHSFFLLVGSQNPLLTSSKNVTLRIRSPKPRPHTAPSPPPQPLTARHSYQRAQTPPLSHIHIREFPDISFPRFTLYMRVLPLWSFHPRMIGCLSLSRPHQRSRSHLHMCQLWLGSPASRERDRLALVIPSSSA